MVTVEPAGAWAQAQFGGAQLGDVRRVRRAVLFAEAMARSPGASIPGLYGRPYDAQATYDFLSRPEARPENLLAGHFARVRRALGAGGTWLLIQDTTTVSFSNRRAPVPGLGPISNGRDSYFQGFSLHSTLAARWQGLAAFTTSVVRHLEIEGLAQQLYWTRRGRPAGERTQDKYKRQKRARESAKWARSASELGRCPAGARWVHIGDRESDVFEFVECCRELGHGFAIRACQDRGLARPANRARRLFPAVRRAMPLGSFSIDLRGRDGCPGRTVRLCVSSTPIVLRSPQRPGRAVGQSSEPCWCVRVRETADKRFSHPPLEWMILTDQPCPRFEQAMEVALQYSCRWKIEEFHKALKTGTRAEQLQLETAPRLMAAVAMKSVVALRLVDLRERVRANPEAPAEDAGLSTLELKVLRAKHFRPVVTVADVALAIGRLGGHMNRKADGLPGTITLSRGMEKLLLLTEGAKLAIDSG